jgi:hypothetical protein
MKKAVIAAVIFVLATAGSGLAHDTTGAQVETIGGIALGRGFGDGDFYKRDFVTGYGGVMMKSFLDGGVKFYTLLRGSTINKGSSGFGGEVILVDNVYKNWWVGLHGGAVENLASSAGGEEIPSGFGGATVFLKFGHVMHAGMHIDLADDGEQLGLAAHIFVGAGVPIGK